MNEPILPTVYKKGLKHSSIIAISSAVRFFFTFLPHVLIAKQLGLGYATDSYLMAISIDQIIVKLSRIGTLPKIFIMVLSEDFVASKKKTESNVNNFVNILVPLSLLAMFLIYFAAPLLVNLIVKGFGADKKFLTISIFRLLIPLFLYRCLISLFEGVFKLHNEFSRWAILSVIGPVIITISVSLYISKIGIYSMVYGILVSSFIHLLLLIYFVYFKFHHSYRFEINFRHELFPKAIKLLFPYYLSSIPVQIMIGIQSFLVSLLPTGFASVFFYARRVIDYVEQFSVNIFSQLMFPYFTKKILQLSIEHIRKAYVQLMCLTNYTHLPLLIIFAILARQIAEVLFANRFTSADIMITLGLTISWLMVFFLAEPSNDVQFNVILAMKRTMWVNLVNVFRTVTVIMLSIILFKYFGFWGLVFSYSLTNLQGFLINQWHLGNKYSFENILVNRQFIKILVLNIILALFCFYLNYFMLHNFAPKYLYQKIAVISTVSTTSIILYIFMSYLVKTKEFYTILAILKVKKNIQ